MFVVLPPVAIAKAELSNLAHTAIRVSMVLLSVLQFYALSKILLHHEYRVIR